MSLRKWWFEVRGMDNIVSGLAASSARVWQPPGAAAAAAEGTGDTWEAADTAEAETRTLPAFCFWWFLHFSSQFCSRICRPRNFPLPLSGTLILPLHLPSLWHRQHGPRLPHLFGTKGKCCRCCWEALRQLCFQRATEFLWTPVKSWWVDRRLQPDAFSLPSSTGQDETIGWKSSWVKIQMGISLKNYHQGKQTWSGELSLLPIKTDLDTKKQRQHTTFTPAPLSQAQLHLFIPDSSTSSMLPELQLQRYVSTFPYIEDWQHFEIYLAGGEKLPKSFITQNWRMN